VRICHRAAAQRASAGVGGSIPCRKNKGFNTQALIDLRDQSSRIRFFLLRAADDAIQHRIAQLGQDTAHLRSLRQASAFSCVPSIESFTSRSSAGSDRCWLALARRRSRSSPLAKLGRRNNPADDTSALAEGALPISVC